MQEIFYVIYSPRQDGYLDEDGNLGQFDKAERFNRPDRCVNLIADERWVGPCVEGETP